MPVRSASLLLWITYLSAAAASSLVAQSSNGEERYRISVRVGGDAVGTFEQVEFLVGARAGLYRIGALGPEVGLSVFPAYLDDQSALMPEAGLAFPQRLGGSVLLWRAGLSPFFIRDEGEWGTSFGAYAGAGLVLPLGPVGLRVDAGPMLWGGSDVRWQIGLGISSVPGPWR